MKRSSSFRRARRPLAFLQFCLLMLALLGLPLTGSSENALPGPGGISKGRGVFMGTETWKDGTTYQVYQYEFEKKSSSSPTILWVYEARVKKAGFTLEQQKDLAVGEVLTGRTEWYTFSGGSKTAYFSLEYSYFSTKAIGMLYVPQGMACDPNPESTSNYSSFQNPIRYSDYVGKISGFLNEDRYADMMEELPDAPDGPITCLYCHGTKKCDNCKGSGTYRNPYTGNLLLCSCENGVCPICDGTGVWN